MTPQQMIVVGGWLIILSCTGLIVWALWDEL